VCISGLCALTFILHYLLVNLVDCKRPLGQPPEVGHNSNNVRGGHRTRCYLGSVSDRGRSCGRMITRSESLAVAAGTGQAVFFIQANGFQSMLPRSRICAAFIHLSR
jgi:hypothetical protein